MLIRNRTEAFLFSLWIGAVSAGAAYVLYEDGRAASKTPSSSAHLPAEDTETGESPRDPGRGN